MENTDLFQNYERRENEKKLLRKKANAIGIGYLLMLAVNFLLSGVLMLADIYIIGGTPITEDVKLLIIQALVSVAMFIPTYIIAGKIGGIKTSRAIRFGKPERSDLVLPFLLAGYGLCTFASVSATYINVIFEIFGISDELGIPILGGVYGFPLSAVVIAVIPALVEEFAYRGVVFSLLRPFGETFTVLTTAVMFGLMHGNIMQIPFAFMVGFVLGTVLIRTGSIWITVLLHFLNNFISVLLETLTDTLPEIYAPFITGAWLILSAAVFAVGMIMLSAKGERFFKFNKSPTALSSGEKALCVITSPVIIIDFVLTLILVFSRVV